MQSTSTSSPPAVALCPLCQQTGRTLQEHAGYQLQWCGGCDFAFVYPPMPQDDHREWHDQDFFVRYYGESIDQFYSRKGALYQREKAKKLWAVQQLARYVKSGSILDIGTGQGMFSYTAREHGYDVHATEVCPMDINYHKSQGLDIFDGYIEDAKFESESFDAVTMWHTLEHMIDPLTTLREVSRILKHGGHLVGALPNWRGLGTQVRLKLNHPLFDPATDHELHFFHYSPRALRTAFEKAGLKVLSIGQEWHRPRRLRDKAVTWTGNALSMVPGVNCRETMTFAAVKP